MKAILAVALLFVAGGAFASDVPAFTDWYAVENLGPVINTSYMDTCVAISKNGLSLFFSSTRHTLNPTSTDRDLYVSKRATTDAPWGEPETLSMLNTPVWDSCPALSLDEHRLYFTSMRSGGCGDRDIWVSHRADRSDDLGWEEPVNLGCQPNGGVNSAAVDVFPTFFEDETGRILMYFGSNRLGQFEIFQSVMNGDDTFGPATSVVELNTPAMEHSVTVRRDGLEVIFGSTRSGEMRFWAATRASTADPWSEPVMVSSLPTNGSGRWAMSFDGRELYFASATLPGYGGIDIWVARRDRMR